MLSKVKCDQTKTRGGLRRKLKFLSKMTRSPPVSPYERMDCDEKKVKPYSMEDIRDKENISAKSNKEVKEKKTKKRSWKRFRQAALTTCRYIGMGVAHMSPATAYAAPDYNIDPKTWNKSFSSSYKSTKGAPPPPPHWTTNMMFSAW
ncbi:unnamed protein product [Larinioides sclopetarius]|uniref:Uncharacterized protein n=1 Tax=Larinioides sclopetarius TaxID=280406 RepID=A0AAV1ZFT2_9ARAC